MARPDRVRHSFPATAERDFAYLHFMRPKRPGRACFACLCQHSRQAETAAIGRTARRSVPTSNSTNQDAQGAKRTHKIRYVEVPTGFGRAGRVLKAWGACLCVAPVCVRIRTGRRRHGAIPRVRRSSKSEDGTEHQRRWSFPTQPSPKRYGGHAERATRAREVEARLKSACAEKLSIGNQQLAAKRKNKCKKPPNPNC